MNKIRQEVYEEFMRVAFPNEKHLPYIMEWGERFEKGIENNWVMGNREEAILIKICKEKGKPYDKEFGLWFCGECNKVKLPNAQTQHSDLYCYECYEERERTRLEARADELKGK
jgi:hypothetical protein